MAVEVRYSGQVVDVRSQRGTVTARAPSWTVGVTSGVLVGGVPYAGSYEVTPDADGEVLPTRSKTMSDDVTVRPIPYVETTNEAGGYTVSIAS